MVSVLAKKSTKPSKAALKAEVIELLEQIKIILKQITDDTGVPRNIRKNAQDAIENILHINEGDNSPAVCASTCISDLEDIAQDLNCPVHTRTQLYQILALLEQVRDY